MASMGCYKLDDGESSPSNLFPVKSFFRQRKEGAGHWLVAHRNATIKKRRKSKERMLHRNIIAGQQTEPDRTKSLDSDKLDTGGNILDRHLLMTLHCVDSPSELCAVDISGQALYSVKTDDLEEFDSVAYINASDNQLTLDAFCRFQSLRELELSVNSLCNLRVNPGDFPHLEVLDLSYNMLLSDDIITLGLLPCLKVLHLTGNKLQTLPDDLTTTHHGSSHLTSAQDEWFCALEVLMLDDNCLSSPGVFTSLAKLKRLRHLNLKGNSITEVPYLQQMGAVRDVKIARETHSTDMPHALCQRDADLCQRDADLCQRDADLSRFPWMQQEHELFDDFRPPFPELRYLNLADNKIAQEEALLAVALFPLLMELVIHSNPLTTQRSGDPPLLTRILQDQLGIQIKRKKADIVMKPHITIPINPKRKIETKIPTVPKLPLFVEDSKHPQALVYSEKTTEGEAKMPFVPHRAPPQMLADSVPQRNTEQRAYTEVPTGGDRMPASDMTCADQIGVDNQDGKTFFMTQLDDEDAWDVKSNRGHSVPEKYKGYELLLDAEPDPEMNCPAGIQQTVKALEKALKNLYVHQEFKPIHNHVQKHRTERKERMAKLQEAKPRPFKEQVVEDCLVKMRDHKNITEVPLGKVLKGKNISKKEYEEAVSLFKDIKTKYKEVYMKAAEQAHQIECAGREL